MGKSIIKLLVCFPSMYVVSDIVIYESNNAQKQWMDTNINICPKIDLSGKINPLIIFWDEYEF